ncbi:MAG: bifunctional pyr operon transcriptional regulator/uracil phosphoribosyltransferase PyrR [Proteobacteria bacterium]|nr:bifunctional pyr operon transcriptional regulator/uracil phosphoribosyltransferase PyrR [Pseudomonadota bacterium]MBU1714309.1 bifunctional pyr operon transcriptional regulator/uracil phosphoribosyltransferase PyrR [Pseudomonadota bacterium]
MEKSQKIIMTASDIERSLSRIALQITERNRDVENLAIVGIHTGGVSLAGRINKFIQDREGHKIPTGSLDITLYRDDWSLASQSPVVKKTDVNFSVEGRNLVLVDDVLFTGRTIRAALDAIMDFGRPRSIQLAVLIDRGGRELPIQPDYVGLQVEVNSDQHVDVLLKDNQADDEVILESD